MEKIKHLYWRAGFGMTPGEWEQQKNWGLSKAIRQLFKEAAGTNTLDVDAMPVAMTRGMSQKDRKEYQLAQKKGVVTQNIDWIRRMASPHEVALVERMSLFWHGHFACRTSAPALAVAQLNTLRTYGLGNFRDLVLAIARDVSMIRFLNNQQNRKASPNENFARELMELFTIGRGHYSEEDIKEAARAFTGWSSNISGAFVFRAQQHDFGQKSFFSKKGDFDGTDIIDILLEQKETAAFITQKIYRYFVNETGHPDLERQLADQFYQSGYDIGGLMQHIFESDWFYFKENTGNKIKSPIELIAGLLRTTGAQLEPPNILLPLQKAMGQELFSPPNVAGWPLGRGWVDNSTLSLRLNLPGYLYKSMNIPFRPKSDLTASGPSGKIGTVKATIDWEPLLSMVQHLAPEEAAEALAAYLLPVPPSVELSRLLGYARKLDQENYLQPLAIAIMSLPEYQLC